MLTRRRPARPANGARTTVRSSRVLSRSYDACADRYPASAFSRSDCDEAFCAISCLVRSRFRCATSRSASAFATCALSSASSTLNSGVPAATPCPSRTRMSTMRPSLRAADRPTEWPRSARSRRSRRRRCRESPAPLRPASAACRRREHHRVMRTWPCCTRPRARPTQLMNDTTSRGFLIGEESLAEDALEAGEGESRPIAGLHEVRLGLGQVYFSVEQIENRRRAALVARLLHPEALPRDGQPFLRQLGARAGGHVGVIRRADVVLDRAIQVLPPGPGNILVHPRARERNLPLAVVPQWERDRKREIRRLEQLREERRVERKCVERQRRVRQVVA